MYCTVLCCLPCCGRPDSCPSACETPHCSVDIRHLDDQLTWRAWREGDTRLDWGGAEVDQATFALGKGAGTPMAALGTPLAPSALGNPPLNRSASWQRGSVICVEICVCLSIHPSIHPSNLIGLSVCLSACLPACLPVGRSVGRSVCLSVYASIHPSTHPSIYMYVCLCLFVSV